MKRWATWAAAAWIVLVSGLYYSRDATVHKLLIKLHILQPQHTAWDCPSPLLHKLLIKLHVLQQKP